MLSGLLHDGRLVMFEIIERIEARPVHKMSFVLLMLTALFAMFALSCSSSRSRRAQPVYFTYTVAPPSETVLTSEITPPPKTTPQQETTPAETLQKPSANTLTTASSADANPILGSWTCDRVWDSEHGSVSCAPPRAGYDLIFTHDTKTIVVRSAEGSTESMETSMRVQGYVVKETNSGYHLDVYFIGVLGNEGEDSYEVSRDRKHLTEPTKGVNGAAKFVRTSESAN
jgi:hypothetical protein